MEALVWLGGSRATAALEHAGLSGLPLARAMTEMAAYAATHKHNIDDWPGTQRGTKRAGPALAGPIRHHAHTQFTHFFKLRQGLTERVVQA